MHKSARALAGVFPSVLLTIAACDPSQTAERPGRAGTPPAGRHAIHSGQLHATMGGLGQEVGRNWPQEIAEERAADAERDREARFGQAGQLARVLARSADEIPKAIPGTGLPEREQAAFMAHARALKNHAGELESSAAARDSGRMQAALDAVKTTCTGCHEQFAELAGPIRFGPGQR